MNISLKSKVTLMACLTIIAPPLILPSPFCSLKLDTGQLSFVSLSAQSSREKANAAASKLEKEFLARNREEGIPSEEEFPQKPYTAQSLIDFMNNKQFGYEYRHHAMQLAGQLPREEYIQVLKSAMEVKDGQMAANAILILLELGELSLDSILNKRILSLPESSQYNLLRWFVQKLPTDSKYRSSSLSRQTLQQLLSPTPVSSKGQSESAAGIKPSPEVIGREASTKAVHAGYACLLLVMSTPVLTENDRALLKVARKQFPRARGVWFAGALAKDITESDIEIGQPICTNTHEFKPLRIAVAIALSPIDSKAQQFFNASIEHLLATASEREDAIHENIKNAESPYSVDTGPSIKFRTELQYVGWLRFYNGANVRTLILGCLNSNSQSVRYCSWIVAAKHFPEEMIIVLKKTTSASVRRTERK